MKGKRQTLATMEERRAELSTLAEAFGEHEQPNPLWLAECVGVIGVLLARGNTMGLMVSALTLLAKAMWQKGYEAAPKLEFMLPEGGVG